MRLNVKPAVQVQAGPVLTTRRAVGGWNHGAMAPVVPPFEPATAAQLARDAARLTALSPTAVPGRTRLR